MQKPIAIWNLKHQVWITNQDCLSFAPDQLWQEALPVSGMTVAGQLFELPMQAHLIGESESLLSQLPTVRAAQGDNRNSNIWERDASKPQNLENALYHILPTPMSRDYKGDTAPHERNGVVQTDTVERAIFHSGQVDLIGTPRTSSRNAATQKQIDAGAPKSRIEDQVLTTNWGKFEPAIRRWESVTRPAPAPTKPDGKDGNHRLSSLFTEWMMGLPDGWVTGHGLKRNDELKMCGNGVVPQQAVLALRHLLQQVELEKATSESQ